MFNVPYSGVSFSICITKFTGTLEELLIAQLLYKQRSVWHAISQQNAKK